MASFAGPRSSGSVALACALVVSPVLIGARQAPGSLHEQLQRVGRYVHDYERAFAAIVAQEAYRQRSRVADGTETTRELASEIALVRADDEWMVFRDVYEVDGRPVRDRDGRLAGLFLQGSGDALPRASRIADESARYNLGPIPRTLNTPTQVLRYLRPETQSRSSFKLEGRRVLNDRDLVVISFTDRGKPRLIYTRDDAPASGRVWVEPESGAIVRTELRLSSEGTSVVLLVDFSLEPKLGMWVPERMTESYEVATRGSHGASGGRLRSSPVQVEATATYSDYRRFTVETKTIIR